MNGFGEANKSEHVVMDKLLKHIQMGGFQTLSDLIEEQSEAIMERILYVYILPLFVKREWLCGYCVRSLEIYDSEYKRHLFQMSY